MDKQCFLPVAAPEKKKKRNLLVVTCSLVYVGTMPKSMHALPQFKL